MLKGKPWTTTTLSQVGGTAGLGVTFREETLSASTAPAAHRQHLKAAQALLRSLLPEAGSNIKGSWRSYEGLLDASGYAPRPTDFDDLIQILDVELRRHRIACRGDYFLPIRTESRLQPSPS